MADCVYLGKNYGLQPMSLEEEMNLPNTIRQTRNNKVQIINDCDNIARTIETLRWRAYACPELDDEEHAKLVDEYARLVREIVNKVNEALGFGYQH